jgi:hypothetical protein
MKKFLIPFIASAGLLLAATTAFAATPLSGYAWSSNIGWLSFNSSDGSTVQLATTTGSSIGTLSGYAWSPNIGWVSFNRGFTGSPPSNDPGNGVGAIATVDMTTGAVSGWMRALAGCQYDLLDLMNGKCTGAGPGNANGVTVAGSNSGWDGWIELSGANHPTVPNLSAISNTATSTQGISLNTSNNQLSGYAWGSDVVGWVSFNTGSSGNNNPPVCVGTTCNPPPSSNLNISCNNGASLGTVPSAGGNETALIGNVSVNGGTGPYQYRWSPNSIIGPWTAWSSSNATLSYSSISATTTYSVYVQAEDSANATSSQIVCGTVTVNGTAGNSNPGVNAPTLWIQNPSNPSDMSKTYTTVRTGSSVPVSYAWPSGLNCVGIQQPTGAPSLTEFTSPALVPLGVTNLTSLNIGVYKIILKCNNNPTGFNNNSNPIMAAIYNFLASGPTYTYSNNNTPVEIDVVSSTIHEK